MPLVNEFWDAKKKGLFTQYPDYVNFHVCSFFSRLISCPQCLNVVLSVIFLGFYCVMYGVAFNPIVLSFNIVTGWVGYPILVKATQR